MHFGKKNDADRNQLLQIPVCKKGVHFFISGMADEPVFFLERSMSIAIPQVAKDGAFWPINSARHFVNTGVLRPIKETEPIYKDEENVGIDEEYPDPEIVCMEAEICEDARMVEEEQPANTEDGDDSVEMEEGNKPSDFSMRPDIFPVKT